MGDKRQNNQLGLAFGEETRREAPQSPGEGTETPTAKRMIESPATHEQLMEEVCERENCLQALKRVRANKGSPGIDGMTVGELSGYLHRTGYQSFAAAIAEIKILRPSVDPSKILLSSVREHL